MHNLNKNNINIIFSQYSRTVILAPHPDDEAIGCAVLIKRLASKADIWIAFLTTGVAPKNSITADIIKKYGSFEEYCKIRKEEKYKAMSKYGCNELIMPKVSSRSLESEIVTIYQKLCNACSKIKPDYIFCPAYEGGHPDHDITNCIAFKLSQTLNIVCYEYAGYYRIKNKECYQQFLPNSLNEVERLNLDLEEIEYKEECFKMYSSQKQLILDNFSSYYESFRVAPIYAYNTPPVPGVTFYESWGLGITVSDVSKACLKLLNYKGD